MKDTDSVLKLATLAAESAIKKESRDIFSRINQVVDRVSIMTSQFATLTARLDSSEDRARAIVREEVHACAKSRKKDRRSDTALVISLCALAYTFIRPWISGNP